MSRFRELSPELARRLLRGDVGMMPADTIYGISASARKPASVERIYRIRRRDRGKPLIILIPSVRTLGEFGVRLSAAERRILAKLWPGPVSAILPCPSKKFAYLHRGTGALAFRVPAPAELRNFLRRSGPLVSTSVNPQGGTPARTIEEGRGYFGKKLDFYADGGRIAGRPSALIRFSESELVVLRAGPAALRGRSAK